MSLAPIFLACKGHEAVSLAGAKQTMAVKAGTWHTATSLAPILHWHAQNMTWTGRARIQNSPQIGTLANPMSGIQPCRYTMQGSQRQPKVGTGCNMITWEAIRWNEWQSHGRYSWHAWGTTQS
ncbi:hypothetical protein DUNSADRAFT_4963 [Dunaliella salina]|uniref:Uncharacterized protein n=1 Tax=Dunaliella salina TaxID=3046 RepID=A0ABQ7FUI4_DUNSA|nr:hypothetical protein DUNSADRAFT_4963 [Dunaliella salina]|eukprot:KAF5826068.1 hypothetical protein DUNSADRAFT_4963 [Dunaliella salina]